MQYRYSKYLNLIVLFVDTVLLNIAYFGAHYWIFNDLNDFFHNQNIKILLFTNLSWIVLSILGKPFKISRISRLTDIWRTMLRFILVQLLSISTLLVLISPSQYSKNQIIFTYIIFSILILIWRTFFIYSIRMYRKFGYNLRNVVIVGYGEIASDLRKYFRLHPEFGFKFMGYFDNNFSNNDTKGKINEIIRYANTNRIDEIYCCLPYVDHSSISKIISYGEKNFIKVKLITDFRGFQNKGVTMENYDNIPILNVTSFPLDEFKNRLLKRTLDIFFSLFIILTFFSWMFPIIAIAIMIDSKGPIFFRQKRSGKSNIDFWCWKFRTMHTHGKSETMQATPNDERITKVGLFLRKTSIDELPQFFNVLYGNMSIVGPRPHMLAHTKEYSKTVERFMARHFVKPGITGLAQTKGYRGETKHVGLMKNRVKLDRFYIENWSLLLDFKIIFHTVIMFVRGDKNAY